MSTETSGTEERIGKRTRRACEQSMTVVPHGRGSGMFDVYSESGNEYVVDLRDGVCECGDFIHREFQGGCKHQRRVRIEFGITDVPHGLRSEHAAPLDVELARRQRGIQSDSDSAPSPDRGTDVDPTPNSVEQQAAKAVLAMPDGGEVIDPSGGRDVQQRRLLANEIACQFVMIETVQDFEPFCTVIEAIQDSILNEWSHEERCQQQVTQPARVVAE